MHDIDTQGRVSISALQRLRLLLCLTEGTEVMSCFYFWYLVASARSTDLSLSNLPDNLRSSSFRCARHRKHMLSTEHPLLLCPDQIKITSHNICLLLCPVCQGVFERIKQIIFTTKEKNKNSVAQCRWIPADAEVRTDFTGNLVHLQYCCWLSERLQNNKRTFKPAAAL